MEKSGLMPLLARRWSPRQFDPEHALSRDECEVLLEAARWAPSAGNSQPWAFHLAARGTSDWVAVADHLLGGSRPWATQASALVVNLAHVTVAETDWEYSEFALYDLGQAVAHMTVQAHWMGLACRQFRAFDKEGLTRTLDVPPHWDIVTMTAIGLPPETANRGQWASTRDATVAWPRRLGPEGP